MTKSMTLNNSPKSRLMTHTQRFPFDQSKTLHDYFYNKDIHVLMVGLSDSGKTTILKSLGFQPSTIRLPNHGGIKVTNSCLNKFKIITFTLDDLDKSRNPDWCPYIYRTKIEAIILVVDLVNYDKMALVKNEINYLLG